MTEKETKKGQHHTSEGDQGRGRVTADTVVTDGASGIERTKELTRRLVRKPPGTQEKLDGTR